jgi:DNA-binding FadR family transcriptional regulator
MPFQPVDTQRLYQQVADQIGELIRAKEFPAGHRLPAERDLAKVLGVSRPVVREAMIALEIAGLVEVRTGSGTYVKPPAGNGSTPLPSKLDDAGPSPFDIISARILLEGEVAAVAAKEASEADLADIAEIHQAMVQQVKDNVPYFGADRQFHERIAYSTHNTVLPTLVAGLWDSQHGEVFSRLSQRRGLHQNRPATLAAHAGVLEALRQRNAKGAREAMHTHLRQVMEVLMREDEEDQS